MKTVLMAILAGLSVILAGVLGWQKLTQPKLIPIVMNQPITNQPVNNQPQGDKQCLATGDIDGYWNRASDEGLVCCSGLKLVYANEYLRADGVCYSIEGVRLPREEREILCNCGDGVCGNAESQCNCPEDCKKATTSDETVGWKIYRDNEYGFELKYPTGASLTEDQVNKKISIMGYVGRSDYALYHSVDDWDLYIYVREVPSGISLGQWGEENLACNVNPACQRPSKPTRYGSTKLVEGEYYPYEESELNGHPALKAKVPLMMGESPLSGVAYYILRDNHIYIIITNTIHEGALPRISQMLSTFKFIK